MIRVLLAAYNLFYMLIACLSSVLITNNNRSTHSVQLNTTMGCFINVSINLVGFTTMPTIFPKPLKINVRLYCMYALSTIIMHTIWSCLASGFIKHFCGIKNYSAAQSRVTRQELHTICEHLLFYVFGVTNPTQFSIFLVCLSSFCVLYPILPACLDLLPIRGSPTDFSHVDIIIYIILLEPQQLHTCILHTVTTNYINVLHCFMTIIVNYDISCMNFQYRKQAKLSVLQVLSRYRK